MYDRKTQKSDVGQVHGFSSGLLKTFSLASGHFTGHYIPAVTVVTRSKMHPYTSL